VPMTLFSALAGLFPAHITNYSILPIHGVTPKEDANAPLSGRVRLADTTNRLLTRPLGPPR